MLAGRIHASDGGVGSHIDPVLNLKGNKFAFSSHSGIEPSSSSPVAADEHRGLLPLPMNQKPIRLGRLAARPGMVGYLQQNTKDENNTNSSSSSSTSPLVSLSAMAKKQQQQQAPPPMQGLLPRPSPAITVSNVNNKDDPILKSVPSPSILSQPPPYFPPNSNPSTPSLSSLSSSTPSATPHAISQVALAKAVAHAALRKKRTRPPSCVRRAISRDVMAAIVGGDDDEEEQVPLKTATTTTITTTTAAINQQPPFSSALFPSQSRSLSHSLPAWVQIAAILGSNSKDDDDLIKSSRNVEAAEAKLAELRAKWQEARMREERSTNALQACQWSLAQAIRARDMQAETVVALGEKRCGLEEAVAEVGCRLDMAQAAWLDTTGCD